MLWKCDAVRRLAFLAELDDDEEILFELEWLDDFVRDAFERRDADVTELEVELWVEDDTARMSELTGIHGNIRRERAVWDSPDSDSVVSLPPWEPDWVLTELEVEDELGLSLDPDSEELFFDC